MLRVVTVGWATSIFLAISYVVTVILGFVISGSAFRQMLEWHTLRGLDLSPAVTFIAGAAGSFLCGWYIALVFVPIYNAFARKAR